MRIMEIVSGTAVNGAVVNCLQITRALRDRGHAMHLVCRPNSWIARQLRGESGIAVVECDLKRWPSDRLRSIANIVNDQRINVVHTHMSSANFFGILLRRLFGIPSVVASAHNRNVQLHWIFNDRVIAVSEATKRYHQRVNRVNGRRIDVVHNFVNTDQYQCDRRMTDDLLVLRDNLGVPRDAQLLGVVGDVIPRKGQEYVVRAMPSIVERNPNAHLLCVGHWRDGYTRQVQADAQRLGVEHRITWSEARDDIQQVLRTLDLVVLPSIEENLPLTILEAMASGLPIVATDVGGIAECVVDQRTGLLVPSRDEARLASAITRVLSDKDLARDLGMAGRERVVSEFSLTSQIKRIEHVFEKATIGRSRAAA